MSSSAPAEGEASSESTPKVVKFFVKAANEGKHELELPLSTSVLDTKKKIAEKCTIPADRQRLIYSGRVMKDEETLEFYKVTDGNTVHMVKSANPPAASSSSTAGGSAARPSVPTNIASGSGNNPLAGLTGARYAGHVQLPSADIFGPDGGMGPLPGPEDVANMMGRPETQAAMNELFNNPQLLDQMINQNPMLRGMGDQARQMLRDPAFRQMLTNPEMLRSMSAMSGLRRGGAGGAFPAPGATDTTPGAAAAAGGQTGGAAAAPANPFGAAGGANPFAALLGGSADPPLYLPGYGGGEGGDYGPSDEEILAQIRLARQMGLLGGAAPPQPRDDRPPEERYAEQLRQLNEMGFYNVQENLRALAASGGDVQGALENLLGG